MSRILLNTKIWLLMLLLSVVSSVYAQDDDFTTWTKFKISHKIDSRFSVSGDVELRTKDDMNKWDRWGLTVGGDYRAYSFLKLVCLVYHRLNQRLSFLLQLFSLL